MQAKGKQKHQKFIKLKLATNTIDSQKVPDSHVFRNNIEKQTCTQVPLLKGLIDHLNQKTQKKLFEQIMQIGLIFISRLQNQFIKTKPTQIICYAAEN